jgi:glucokinase
MPNEYIVCIDMGGTKQLACVINSSDGIIARAKQPTDPQSTERDYIKSIAKIIKDVIKSSGVSKENIKAVCLGMAGSVNKGTIYLAPNLGLKNFNIKKLLENEIDYPVLLENDVNLAALGIKNFEVDESSKNLLAMFIGTGIGGGLVLNGKLYRGSNFVAGEIGHMLVKKDGVVCGCGRRGCFETIASRSAITNKIINDVKNGKESSLAKMIEAGEIIKSKSLAKAVKDDDELVTGHIMDACDVIGGVLASVTNLLNLDKIVLGGGLVEALGYFMVPQIEESLQRHVLDESLMGLEITETKLGDDAAIYGGIKLVEEFLGESV